MKTKKNSQILYQSGLILFLVGFFCFFGVAKADNPTPIFQESFESLAAVTANGASSHDNLTFEPGKTGNGVRIKANANLRYPGAGKIDIQKGTMEFWVKPDWDGGTDLGQTGSGNGADGSVYQRGNRYFLTIFDGGNVWSAPHRFSCKLGAYSAKSNPPAAVNNIFFSSFGYPGVNVENQTSSVKTWKPNTWHKITMYWDFTLPDNADGTHNGYFVTKIDDQYFVQTDSSGKMQKIAPFGADDFGADTIMIFGQDHILGRYPADAVYDDFKIYGQSLLPVIPFPAARFNPSDPASIANFRKLFENDDFCSGFESANNNPADCSKLDNSLGSGKNLLFFQKPTLEQVYESTVPAAGEIKSTMDYQSAQGQYADLFFNAYSRENLNNVRVTTTAFSGPGGATIPRENLDLRVVKNWFQAGSGTVNDQLPRYVPELMLYNDQVSFETDPTLIQQRVPSIPHLDHVETKLDQFTSKQFVVITNVPKGTPSGTYTATVTLTADGLSAQTVNLELQVLPFELRESEKRLQSTGTSLYIRNGNPITTLDDYYNLYKPYYQDIKDHGFNEIMQGFNLDWTQGWYKYLGTMLDLFRVKSKLAKDTGFKNELLYEFLAPSQFERITSTDWMSVFREHGFEPWFYGTDEFCGDMSNKLCHHNWGMDTITTMEGHILKSYLIHQIGGKIADTGSNGNFKRIDNCSDSIYAQLYANVAKFMPSLTLPPGICPPSEMAIYAAGESYLWELGAGKVSKTPNRLESYYWQGEDEDPWHNRYNMGYFLWNSKVDGAFPWGYVASDYNDFSASKFDGSYFFRRNTQAYTSLEGPVPTMQWEASREGINDLRYIETWKYYKDLVAKTDPTLAAQSESVVNVALAHHWDQARSDWNTLAGYHSPMSQYESDRKTIAAEIVKLAAAVGPQYNADLNADAKIDLSDFNIFKLDFLKLTASLLNPKSDINADGQATVRDVGILMSGWKP